MTFAIAAAGTGGHVYPGLAVAEALTARGIPPTDICFLGGARMEKSTVPAAGFPFVELELQGLARSLSPRNLMLPFVVRRAVVRSRQVMNERGIQVVLGMGGYVTVPVGLAARRDRRIVLHEQNAHAGVANRIVARWADRVFVSFPSTANLAGEIVGNPLRSRFRDFDAARLRADAFMHYDLDPEQATIGVFGGSLGAGALNGAIARLARTWGGGELQIVHLAGATHADGIDITHDVPAVTRRVVGFEDSMELFYAASDIAVTRAGGSLFEVAATGTPALVVPGSFGGGHQRLNADAMASAGAAVVVEEDQLEELGDVVAGLMADRSKRSAMAASALGVARPDAADRVASAMMELADV